MQSIRKIIGSPVLRMYASDFYSLSKVAIWVGGSAFATKLLELLVEYSANHDFGHYTFIIMGLLNILGVAIKKFFSNTEKEIEVN